MRSDGPVLMAPLTKRIVGAFYRAHTKLGFGFPENICSNALVVELDRDGLRTTREMPIEVVYDGVLIGRYRLDLVVEGAVLVEVKTSKAPTEADTRQLLTYLKATEFEIGLLLHFGPSATFKRFVYANARKSLVASRTLCVSPRNPR